MRLRDPTLAPAAGFDWSRVQWGGPDDRPSDTCSYCGAPLGEHPLRLFSPAGRAAAFCGGCQETWWGLVAVVPLEADCDDDGEPFEDEPA